MEKFKVVKKAGLYDTKGDCVIPVIYDDIQKSKNGVYVCKFESSTDNYSPYKDNYHLYTKKGKLEYQYSDKIINLFYDDKEEIIALQVSNGLGFEWHMVEIDYENNSIKKVYENNIDMIKVEKYGTLLLFSTKSATKEIYSIKKKKSVLCLDNSKQIVSVYKNGFVIESQGNKGFWNLQGKQVLACEWDLILPYDIFVVVAKKCTEYNYNYGVYSYEGKELFPCIYVGNEYYIGIDPICVEINKEKIWIFRSKEFVDGTWYTKLVTIDDEDILVTKQTSAWIYVYDGNSVLVEYPKKAILCRLEKNTEGKLKAVEVLEADKIKKLSEYGLYEVCQGKSRFICNKEGGVVESKKRKKMFEKIGSMNIKKNWRIMREIQQ